MKKLPYRKLKQGSIEFMPAPDGLGWFVEFELPRCSFLNKRVKTWVFREQGMVRTNLGQFADLSEIEIYRLAVIALRNQLDRWLLWLDKAAEQERHLTQCAVDGCTCGAKINVHTKGCPLAVDTGDGVRDNVHDKRVERLQ